jgi:hypothetical protein
MSFDLNGWWVGRRAVANGIAVVTEELGCMEDQMCLVLSRHLELEGSWAKLFNNLVGAIVLCS